MISNLYLSAIQVKNEWDRSLSDALNLEDPDAAIDALDELKTSRDLFIRKTRRALKRAEARIAHTNTALLTPNELSEHMALARKHEIDADELNHLLSSWERAHDFDSILGA